MSLTRFALRVSAVRAIRGQTLAGMNVLDSMSQRIDNRISADRQAVISVYTDDQRDDVSGRGDIGSENPVVDLILELAVSEATTYTLEGETSEQVAIPQTDPAMEMLLDIIERQAISALTTGVGPWASIWRTIATNIRAKVSRRGVFDEAGGRFAARQVTMSIETTLEPVKGSGFALSPGSVWQKFVDQLEADAGLAPIAPMVRAELGSEVIAEPMLAAAMLGVDLNVADDIGLGSMQGGGEAPAELTDFGIVEGMPDE